MIFMEKLFDDAQVGWKVLGDVAKYEQPTKYLVKTTNYSEDFETPVLTAGKTFILGYTDEIDGVYKASENPVIIFDDFTTANRWVDFDFKAKSSAMKMISSVDESKVSSKYIYYWLNTLPKELVEGDHKRQWIGNYAKKEIPIPCPENPKKSLEIQAEIVQILDKFSAMTAELTAELNTRTKQYNYYRDQLFNFEESEVEWRKLGEVVSIKHGKDWKSLGIGDIPVYGSGGVMQYVDTFAYDKPTVLIPRKGSITNIFYVESPFWNVDTIYYTEIDTKQIIPKFFYYFMKTIDLMQLDTGSGRPSLTQAILNEIKVPIPYLDKQAHIVTVLDKFDALTSSITEGLPREIELRQQQYEYYRDLLFSFPNSATVEA
ncbi:restriction endonuclease subunit S [Acinetobacter sp. MD2(2019)]|uniref:restriction endonuclease subunit S n=1 Tax=Acinetobacter sp. MD2(2019) TaxID=2605273 RepID=UPI002D1F4930|nr:restriction endonuclease subunit S [Acinetobacter sp. MD2(2019)]MEB3755047.1 restriction endonuclease subunit S [Acinetobacter sp. MD2(2019)]